MTSRKTKEPFRERALRRLYYIILTSSNLVKNIQQDLLYALPCSGFLFSLCIYLAPHYALPRNDYISTPKFPCFPRSEARSVLTNYLVIKISDLDGMKNFAFDNSEDMIG